jgi:hypothetical protein
MPFILEAHHAFMEMLPNDLAQAGLSARDQLSSYARTTAASNVNGAASASAMQGAMAGAARAAIFADALLQAMHARLEELKSVSAKS